MTASPQSSPLFESKRTGPLTGVRVLDLSRLLPGPACSWYLSEMGADVVCLEPLKGTPARFLPPLYQNEGSYFTALHGGKKSGAVLFRQGFENQRKNVYKVKKFEEYFKKKLKS